MQHKVKLAVKNKVNLIPLGLTPKLSQTLITSRPLRLGGSFFPNYA
jgi:hypothetical protein